MKRSQLKRKTPFKAKRRYTKATARRRKRGEWSTDTADTYFSLYVRERDGKCLRCGATERLDCSHYHRRGHSGTRYDPENCIALCRSCHNLWEGPKADYTRFMISWLGNDAFIQLALKAGKTVARADAIRECQALLSTARPKIDGY